MRTLLSRLVLSACALAVVLSVSGCEYEAIGRVIAAMN